LRMNSVSAMLRPAEDRPIWINARART
jgi:hypothetical protein